MLRKLGCAVLFGFGLGPVLAGCGSAWDGPVFATNEDVKLSYVGDGPIRLKRLPDDPYDKDRPPVFALTGRDAGTACELWVTDKSADGAKTELLLPRGEVAHLFGAHHATVDYEREIDRRPYPYWHAVHRQPNTIVWRLFGSFGGYPTQVACATERKSSSLSVRKRPRPYAFELDAAFRTVGFAYSQGGLSGLYYENDFVAYGHVGPYPPTTPRRPELRQRSESQER